MIHVQQMSGIVMPRPKRRLPSRHPRTGEWLATVLLHQAQPAGVIVALAASACGGRLAAELVDLALGDHRAGRTMHTQGEDIAVHGLPY